jgi:hypothetical protein
VDVQEMSLWMIRARAKSRNARPRQIKRELVDDQDEVK